MDEKEIQKLTEGIKASFEIGFYANKTGFEGKLDEYFDRGILTKGLTEIPKGLEAEAEQIAQGYANENKIEIEQSRKAVRRYILRYPIVREDMDRFERGSRLSKEQLFREATI